MWSAMGTIVIAALVGLGVVGAGDGGGVGAGVGAGDGAPVGAGSGSAVGAGVGTDDNVGADDTVGAAVGIRSAKCTIAAVKLPFKTASSKAVVTYACAESWPRRTASIRGTVTSVSTVTVASLEEHEVCRLRLATSAASSARLQIYINLIAPWK